MTALDSIASRNNTAVTIQLKGQRVGRVQSFRSSQANNVQVITELGRDYAVEMQKGITLFTFAISSFYVRDDVFDSIRNGEEFSLVIQDGAGIVETLDSFDKCMVQSLDRSYSNGAVTVGQDASVAALGKGKLGLT